jgi:hypothetical protein
MKKTILFIAILFSSIFIRAQNCNDVVYPTAGKSVIFDCCIDEVYDGNKVRFTKNDTTSVIEAISIIKAGLTLNLLPLESFAIYKGHNYNYYAGRYQLANQRKTAGFIVGAIGFAEMLTGLIMLDTADEPFPQLFIFVGSITFSVGVPLAISGGIEASNNKEAMAKAKSNTSLAFGITNNGLGLLFNF